MVAYNKQDYAPAITHYTHFLQKIEQNCCRPITNQYYNIRVELYLGDALLKTGQAKEALPHFEAISNSKRLNQEEEIKYLEAAKWYTALAYLELVQVQEAVQILQELQSSTFYKQKSQQLLLELK
jgi:tetratricopeptide (TPR) repeat protein